MPKKKKNHCALVLVFNVFVLLIIAVPVDINKRMLCLFCEDAFGLQEGLAPVETCRPLKNHSAWLLVFLGGVSLKGPTDWKLKLFISSWCHH